MDRLAEIDPPHEASDEHEFTGPDGWSYWTRVLRVDADGPMLGHFALRGTDRRAIDWSPYHRMKPIQFRWVVLLGFPFRIGLGPLTPLDLRHLWDTRLRAEAITVAAELGLAAMEGGIGADRCGELAQRLMGPDHPGFVGSTR